MCDKWSVRWIKSEQPHPAATMSHKFPVWFWIHLTDRALWPLSTQSRSSCQEHSCFLPGHEFLVDLQTQSNWHSPASWLVWSSVLPTKHRNREAVYCFLLLSWAKGDDRHRWILFKLWWNHPNISTTKLATIIWSVAKLFHKRGLDWFWIANPQVQPRLRRTTWWRCGGA